MRIDAHFNQMVQIKESEVNTMPKAILELEMPESCWKCPCSWRIRDNVIACEVTKHYCPEEGRRPDCPLKLVEDKEVE